MGAGAVPVTSNGLGVQSCADIELLAYPVEQPAGNPEMVGHGGCADGTDLEFPLSGHDLTVDTGNLQSSFHASVKVSFNYGASKHLIRAYTAVVAALGSGEPVVRPAKGLDAVEIGVLLLNAEPHVHCAVFLG